MLGCHLLLRLTSSVYPHNHVCCWNRVDGDACSDNSAEGSDLATSGMPGSMPDDNHESESQEAAAAPASAAKEGDDIDKEVN